MKKIYTVVLPFVFGMYFNLLALFSKKKAAKKAFLLFCTPRKGKITTNQKEFLATAKDRFITIGNHSIKIYEWSGSGAAVLLAHGWESNSWRWHKLVAVLKEQNYHIIAFDAPAHGDSSGAIFNVPLYADCMDHMIHTYDPKFVVGHSIGGMTALYQQHKFPKNSVQKLVTIGAPSELSVFMEQYQETLNLSKRVMLALDAYFVEHFGFHIADFKTFLFAKTLSKPGLILHDEEDPIAHISASEKVHQNWKNSCFVRTNGLGHSMHQDQVNREILGFLNS